jgi:hypothetical protein
MVDKPIADYASVAADPKFPVSFKVNKETHKATQDYASLDLLRYRDVVNIPETFDQTWNYLDPFQRAHWREAITHEYIKMEQIEVLD